MNELCIKLAGKIKELIEEYDYMSFTTDIWTDPSSVTEEKIKHEIIKMVNDPVVTDSPISPAGKIKRMRMGDSLDPEPETSSTGRKTCLKSVLAMNLGSSGEDEGEGEPDNSSPDLLFSAKN
ncbi:hypothetical protein EVAR_3100_1 [Eumeta japonica]|uniref:Zinc finger BED domain-containing protein 4 n=1 Tax=Eumeta variegata TaxID=151549 RepID=A0A4C1XG49_EUMVA|nr:hypothetical protein EVAR_3100_1 [Eumeta japonica]